MAPGTHTPLRNGAPIGQSKPFRDGSRLVRTKKL